MTGLCDLHVHGGAGHDFMSADARGLEAIREHLARHGVTRYLATTVTAPWKETLAAVRRLSRAGLDLHLEGPFLSPARRGVHPEGLLLAPTIARLDEAWEASEGRIRMITLAPELAGALEFTAAAVERGIVVSMGHSDATYEQARAGVEAGARHVTHWGNAMRAMEQREPGLMGLALTDARASLEIIADGVHVHPTLVALALRTKPAGKAMLVSDGISAAGCGDGRFELGGMQVEVKDGVCRLGGRLAGSVLTLDRAVENAARFAGASREEAAVWARENPRQLVTA